MSSGAGAVNLNVNLRRDARPEVLLKELVLSPLIYIRLAGIVSLLMNLLICKELNNLA